MLTLSTLKSSKGAHRKRKRIGRGPGSGRGTQAGKGHKGQKARSGGGVRTGFIGGAMPLYMKLPKKGFSNVRFKQEHALISLRQLENRFSEGDEVSRGTLIERGLLKGKDRNRPIKILCNGELKGPLRFVGIEKFSLSAKRAVEGAGGTIQQKGQ